MLKDNIKVTGDLYIQKIAGDGTITNYEEHNLIVTNGKNFIASRMKDATAPVMTHMAVGNSATTPLTTDLKLGGGVAGVSATELGRVALASTTVVNNTVTYVATFPENVGTGSIVEAGLFNTGTNDASSGMLARSTFGTITKEAADTITITWVVTIA